MSRASLLLSAGLLFGGLFAASCSRGPGDVPPRASFATWDEFLARPDADRDTKVVFIGLDGVRWDLVDPLIQRGLLPNFARLKAESAWGVLQSTECYISPPAWATMMTGFLPEHTGIYNFGHWSPKQRRFLPLRSTDILVPAVWDIASLGGANTAVVNVPLTYPVTEVNGIMVSGLLTPIRHRNRTAFQLRAARVADGKLPPGLPLSYSGYMKATLDYVGNHFDFFIYDGVNDNVARFDRVATFVRTAGGELRDAYAKLATFAPWVQVDVVDKEEGENEKGWCRFAVIPTQNQDTYVARFSQVLWSSSDTDVQYTFPESVAQDINQRFGRYMPSTYLDRELIPDHTVDAVNYARYFFDYDDWDLYFYVFTQTDNILHEDGMSPIADQVFSQIDRFLGDLLDRLSDDHVLILASDHGFGEYDMAIDLNRVFEQVGLTSYKNDKELDFSRSLAFHNMWSVYFNDSLLTREELQRRGIDCPATSHPRTVLADYIRDLGRRFFRERMDRDLELVFEEVDTSAAGSPPAMVVQGTYPGYQIEFWNLNKSRPEIITRLQGGARWFHTRDGMYLVHGRGVKSGFHGPATGIENVTPTILYLLGLPTPTNADGTIISEIFEPDALARKPRYVVEDYAALPRQTDLDDERRESLEKQLRSLGYIR